MKKLHQAPSNHCFLYVGYITYVIVRNYGNGEGDRMRRYDTFAIACSEPVRIGCELKLGHSKRLIREMDAMIAGDPDFDYDGVAIQKLIDASHGQNTQGIAS